MISDGAFAQAGDISSYLRDMFKDILQEMLEQEMVQELGYEKGDSINKILITDETDIVKRLLNHNLEI